MRVDLIRDPDYEHLDRQTPGTWIVFEGTQLVYSCATLELPWKDNEPEISCIPTGLYEVIRATPTKRIPYECFQLLNVPGRGGIKVHRANYVTQLLGCIAVGQSHTDINSDGLIDVVKSKDTLEYLLKILPSYFKLRIL